MGHYKYLGRSNRLVSPNPSSIGDENWTVKGQPPSCVTFTNHRQTWCAFLVPQFSINTKCDHCKTFYILSFAQSWMGPIMSIMRSSGELHVPFYLVRVGVSKVKSQHTFQFSANAVTKVLKRQLKKHIQFRKSCHWKHWFSINLKEKYFLSKVMACCLMAPNHTLYQCWFLLSEVLRHSPERNYTASAQDIILYDESENYAFKVTSGNPSVKHCMKQKCHNRLGCQKLHTHKFRFRYVDSIIF